MVPFLQAVIGDMISLVAVMAIIGAIIKLFQIATSLNEIRDLLVEIKRNTQDYSPTASAGLRHYPEPSSLDALHGRPDAGSLHTAVLNPEP